MSKRIAVLGAGPIGLEAALAATRAGHVATVYERGDVAQNVADWGFVTLFSPWRMNISDAGRAAVGLDVDDDACPTGRELRERYLVPLSAHLDVRTHACVVSVGKAGVAKHHAIGDAAARAASPFRLLVADKAGERVELADVVLDCTGTYGESTARALGRGGMPAPGEAAARAAGRVRYTLPDVLGRDRGLFADRHALLVGCGYSAATLLRDLGELARAAPRTRATWVVRQAGPALHATASDALPERRELVDRVVQLAQDPPKWLSFKPGMQVEAIRLANARDPLTGRLTADLSPDNAGSGGAAESVEVDRIVGLVGYAPDDGLWRQLQVHQCYATFGPMKMSAALLGESAGAEGAGGDCLTVGSSLGPDTLKNPEPNFYVLGAKSYGTNSSFLMQVGLRQVTDVMGLMG